MRSMTGSRGSSRGRRAGRPPRARSASVCSSSTISWALAGSRLASGSSSRSSRGRLISAWAISTRCCSPPERVPTRASAKRSASTACEHLVDRDCALPRRQRQPEAVAVDAERRPGRGPQRDIRIEQRPSGGRSRPSGAPRPRRAGAPSTRPAPVRCRPRMTRSSVVLPAPLEPISPVNSPGADREGDVVEDRPARERHLDVLDVERCPPPTRPVRMRPRHRCSVETRAPRRPGWRSTSASIQLW